MGPMEISSLNVGYRASACRCFDNSRARSQSLLPSLGGQWQKLRKRSLAQADQLPLIRGRHRQKHSHSDTAPGRASSSAPLWSARPRSSSFRRSMTLVCSVAVEQGESNEEVADDVVDGSILTGDGSEMQNTLRLVECAMLAATAGLAYFLSNLFRLEGYLGCFFPLPVVMSSMKWGASAGRKTMVATALLLLVLSGPVKSASYLLMHGFVGLAIGSLWRWRCNWWVSLVTCTLVWTSATHLDLEDVLAVKVRCFGAMGFVLLSSWLIRENLLALITINAHASVSYLLASLGINIYPSMLMIYFIFGGLLFLNCGSFVFLLHVLYVIFLKRLGIDTKIAVPGWIERAM